MEKKLIHSNLPTNLYSRHVTIAHSRHRQNAVATIIIKACLKKINWACEHLQ